MHKFFRITAAAAFAFTAISAAAQTMKAADVHPAGYPTVVAVEAMGKKLEAATGLPWLMRAAATHHWAPPRMKPRVPSIGSTIHWRSDS